MRKAILLLFIVPLLVGLCTAQVTYSSDKEVTTYYAQINPDLEGKAFFQIDVQNFNYTQDKILGIAILNPLIDNCSYSETELSCDYTISSPNASIDIYYNNGKIETTNKYSAELLFLNSAGPHSLFPSQRYYIKTTDEIRNNNLSHFTLKYYDSNLNSEMHYDKYPFDSYSFTYDIAFLNESLVILTISPINPSNSYDINVYINHIYKGNGENHFEENIPSVYNGVYKFDFKTAENESLNEIKIIYTRKIGLPQLSYYILLSLIIPIILSICCIIYKKRQNDFNAIVFGTVLTIYIFSASIGFAYKPTWMIAYSYFDMVFYIDSILIIAYFVCLMWKWES